MGHTVHHSRPNIGTSAMISSAHHTIHTKMMPKLRLPAGVPKNPASTASVNTPSVASISTGWNNREVSTLRRAG